ncbi:Helicase-like transcription factor [Teratosphaeria destructans]|uniref:Helicase-like transcription factor n=1 Tax=Teratosphaeria destructans TaxID=418781 RepID=A0A9W7SNX3_9PEZI|nr:Helicase-like transcription factor [Teratosphaeria destructans]
MHITYGLYPYSSSKYDEYLDAKANRGKKERRVWTEENYKGPSAKVQALLQELEESRRQTASLPEGEPPIRSVVFSGWTAYLDLIEVALDEQSINFVRLDGSMSVKQRSAVLRQFATDPDITVILVSIKAGGQGLNFTAANKVYMMEPQYNPGVEHQAIDRVHRLGQQREVVIKHFIMKDSVEEGILGLQEKKVRLAQRTLERGGGKKSKDQRDEERIEELRRLFGGK